MCKLYASNHIANSIDMRLACLTERIDLNRAIHRANVRILKTDTFCVRNTANGNQHFLGCEQHIAIGSVRCKG
ncbi:hypothetical protein D3C78_1745160 [compost metagenome]